MDCADKRRGNPTVHIKWDSNTAILSGDAMAFAFGFYINKRRLGYSIFGVMLCAYLIGVVININQESTGNPRISAMGITQHQGTTEGKEVRFGSAATALWSVSTTATSNGSINGMHDSMIAGVGKTCRMLRDAKDLFGNGIDVQIGYIETHGRAETEKLLKGLPVIP